MEHDIKGFNTSKVSYLRNGLINCLLLVDKFTDFNLIQYYHRNLVDCSYQKERNRTAHSCANNQQPSKQTVYQFTVVQSLQFYI